MRRSLVVALALVAVSGAALGRLGLETHPREALQGQELLYLPNGKYLKAISLGHAPLVADLLYLWAIQYYSDYGRTDRYRFVEHVFGDVIAELDPHFVDPYWLGALILSVEKRDLPAALRLLDKGFERNPDQWLLPYLAGWECDRAHDYALAASYFERAAGVASAPAFVRRIRAGMIARAGNLRDALALWEEILSDPRSDDAARAVAERQVRSLRERVDQEQIRTAIASYRARFGRPPRRLDDLVDVRLLSAIPLDRDGRPYPYDSDTGVVANPAGRILGRP